MSDLFGNKATEPFRTLGFYQPFGSLMLHGKVETRWVKEGKKPPFPLGKYLFYTTQQPCGNYRLFDWCGPGVVLSIDHLLMNDETRKLNGYAFATAELFKVAHLTESDLSFVTFYGTKTFHDKDYNEVLKRQWALHFKNVTPIDPFEWKFGKQGIGFVPQSELHKIKLIN